MAEKKPKASNPEERARLRKLNEQVRSLKTQVKEGKVQLKQAIEERKTLKPKGAKAAAPE